MLKKLSGTILVAAISFSAIAQDSTKTFALSGSLDAYYRFNNGKGTTNNKTSFTNSANSFELGMASLRADATALSGKVTATVDLGVGNRAFEFSYNDDKPLAIIKQAFVTFAPSDKFKLTAGKFGTHVGYEVLDPFANRNYSMSYMFTNGPFFHTGLKADVTLGKVGLMAGVAQHVDQTSFTGILYDGSTTSNIKDLLAQVSLTASDKWKLYLNYWGFFGVKTGHSTNGSQSTSQLDFVTTGTITEKFSIGANATMQTLKLNAATKTENKSWFGGALYLNYDPSSILGITLRNEIIADKDMIKFGMAENIFQSTLSFNLKAGPLTFIPELRVDNSKNEIFVNADGDPTKSTFSAILAAVYKF